MRRTYLQIFILFMIVCIIYQLMNQPEKVKETFDPAESRNFANKFVEEEFHRYKLYEKHKRFPDVIISGASKCGTDFLKHYLHGNPYFTGVHEDAHYFDSAVNYQKGPKWYMSLMPRVYPYHRVYEKTPSYFSIKKVPGR